MEIETETDVKRTLPVRRGVTGEFIPLERLFPGQGATTAFLDSRHQEEVRQKHKHTERKSNRKRREISYVCGQREIEKGETRYKER